MSELFPDILLNLFPEGIGLIAWVVAVVLAVKMIRRGGAKPERLLLTGTSLMLASSFIGSVFAVIRPLLILWLAQTSGALSLNSIMPWFSGVSMFQGLVALAGIIFLVYAFWVKFKRGIQPVPEAVNTDEVQEQSE